MTLHKKITTAVLTLAAASAATAQTAYFDDIVAGQIFGDTNISVTVQTSNLDGYDYDFVIENNASSDDTTITGFYFEAGWEMLFGNSTSDRSFSFGLDDPNNFIENDAIPRHNGAAIPGWSRSLVSYEVEDLDDGVGPGQAVVISYDAFANNLLLEDIENRIGLFGLNIGLRLQNLPGQDPGATAFALADINGEANNGPIEVGNEGGPVMPEPTSGVVMGLGALMGIALKRRRRDV